MTLDELRSAERLRDHLRRCAPPVPDPVSWRDLWVLSAMTWINAGPQRAELRLAALDEIGADLGYERPDLFQLAEDALDKPKAKARARG